MNPINIIKEVYRTSDQKVERLNYLTTGLQHWYQAYPDFHYLQPCVIEGKAALICQRELSQISPLAYRALKRICERYDIFLKEDARSSKKDPPAFIKNRRKKAIVLTFCLAMVSSVEAANFDNYALSTASQIEMQNQAVSLEFKQQTLYDVTNNIARKTGITFKLNAAIGQDMIDKKLKASNWKSALRQLLRGYNYATVQEDNAIKTIFITGYEGGIKPIEDLKSGSEFRADSASDDSVSINNGSDIIDVYIQTDELAELPEGDEMLIDLPVGSFTVKQKSMIKLDDGGMTWVGTMDDENQFYRLYLAQTQAGEVIGNVFTPFGIYNIETIDGQTVMVAIEQSNTW